MIITRTSSYLQMYGCTVLFDILYIQNMYTSYSENWRRRLTEASITEFVAVIRTNSTDDGKVDRDPCNTSTFVSHV